MNEMVRDLARRPGMFSDDAQINVDLLANHQQTFGARLKKRDVPNAVCLLHSNSHTYGDYFL